MELLPIFIMPAFLAEERNKKQEDWINNKTRIIACTNAFGMGIDKPDVRTVVHYDVPDALKIITRKQAGPGAMAKRLMLFYLYTTTELKH